MWILTNISQDTDGMICAGNPTVFETEEAAIKNAKENLADDFGISLYEVTRKANENSNPYVLSMAQDGRLEVYTVACLGAKSIVNHSVNRLLANLNSKREKVEIPDSFSFSCKVPVPVSISNDISSFRMAEAEILFSGSLDKNSEWVKRAATVDIPELYIDHEIEIRFFDNLRSYLSDTPESNFDIIKNKKNFENRIKVLVQKDIEHLNAHLDRVHIQKISNL